MDKHADRIQPSRRQFLRTLSGLCLGAATCLTEAAQAAQSAYPDRFQVDGGLVVLPSRGKLYVASDFHARWRDFQSWLERSQVLTRLKEDEGTYAVVLGDAVDIKEDAEGPDPESDPDGDSRIIDRIREIQQEEAGRRFIFLLGNHELEVLRIDAWLAAREKAGEERPKALARLLKQIPGLEQYNFIRRMTPEQQRFLARLPVAFLGKSGVVGVHGAPAKSARAIQEVARREMRVTTELVWGRPLGVNTTAAEQDYDRDDVKRFLKVMEDSSLLVSGHNGPRWLPPAWSRDGVAIYGDHQLILATSVGAWPDGKRYLTLDLGKRYRNAADCILGREIQKL